jgi:hypothetical protein
LTTLTGGLTSGLAGWLRGGGEVVDMDREKARNLSCGSQRRSGSKPDAANGDGSVKRAGVKGPRSRF